MALYDRCLAMGIRADVVNTPREVSASCGISVRVHPADYRAAHGLATRIAAYVGAYAVQNTLSRRLVRRLD